MDEIIKNSFVRKIRAKNIYVTFYFIDVSTLNSSYCQSNLFQLEKIISV